MKPFIFILSLLGILIFSPQVFALKMESVYTNTPGEIVVLFESLPKDDIFHKSDFQLMIEHQQVTIAKEIKTVDSPKKDFALIVCIDVSGPMKEERIGEIKSALSFLIGLANKRLEDRIALISFAKDIKTVTSFQQTRLQLLDAVLELQPAKSTTCLFDALSKALDLFDEVNQPKHHQIIVISDGKDDGSGITIENVILKAQKKEVLIDAIGYGIDKKFGPVLRKVAESSGGHFIETDPDVLNLKSGITKCYEGILERRRSLMVQFVYLAEWSMGKTANASIAVDLPKGKRQVLDLPGKFAPPKQRISIEPEYREPKNTPPEHTRVLPAVPTHEHDIAHKQSWLSQNRLFLSIIILIVILVLGIFLVLYLRRLKIKQGLADQETFVKPYEDHNTVLIPRSSSPGTLVGGYLYPPPMPNNPCAKLVGLSGPLSNICHAIDKKILSIGSDKKNDLCISDDDHVSKNHAYLRYEKGSLFIFDNESQNGTLVNQKRVLDTGVSIEPEDQITIGLSTFVIKKHFWEQTESE